MNMYKKKKKKLHDFTIAGIKWTKSVEKLQPHEDAQILQQTWTLVTWKAKLVHAIIN